MTSQTCPAQRRPFSADSFRPVKESGAVGGRDPRILNLSFFVFLVVNNMIVLSGNPYGSDFVLKFQSTLQKDNRSTLCCPKLD